MEKFRNGWRDIEKGKKRNIQRRMGSILGKVVNISRELPVNISHDLLVNISHESW